MIQRSLILLFALLGITSMAFGSNKVKIIQEKDLTLQHVVNRAAYVTGVKYYSTEKLDTKVSTVSLDITRENADAIISSLLHSNDLIRVKENDKLFKIIPAKDIKFIVVPSLSASVKNKPRFPQTYDHYLLKYAVADNDDTRALSETIEPYLSKYGEIINASQNGELVIRDSAKNLAKIYKVLKSAENTEVFISLNEREHEKHILKENGPKDS